MGNPYVKLLSIVDPNEASTEFAKARGTTPRKNITYNAASGGGSPGTVVSLSSIVQSTLDKINTFLPILLGLLAFNALILLLLLKWLISQLHPNRLSLPLLILPQTFHLTL